MLNNFDDIILNRRTCRAFTPEKPSQDQIKSILKAGLHAPYAALALKEGQKFRQFVVVSGISEKMQKIRDLVKAHTAKLAKIIPLINLIFPGKIPQTFIDRVKTNLLGEAPVYIFIVEPKGFPPVAPQSISHCLENMWLKATEIGLGFRLISVFESMSRNKDFLNILSLEKGVYSINCCSIGYPAYPLEISKRPSLDELITWFD